MRSSERQAVSRREFLRGTVATGVGLAGWHAAGGQHTATAAMTTTLNFKGWNYEPDLVQENLDIFKQQHPGIQVKYEAIGGNYMDKIAALFIADSDLDCLYVRDTNFAGWVDAGWLRPIEGLPGVEEYKKLDSCVLAIRPTSSGCCPFSLLGKQYGEYLCCGLSPLQKVMCIED